MSGIPSAGRSRVAVVSPFLDKRHGTERAVVEPISRLAEEYEIHVYSQRVQDLDLTKIRWHRIPELPGPYIFNWIWWFAANHIWRLWDRWFNHLLPDITFSPGVNCLDADLVCVHIVFAEFRAQARRELELRRNPPWFWPRLLHRRAYYQLIISLEDIVYRRGDLLMAAVSHKVAQELVRYYDRTDEITLLYHGIDSNQFSPQRRESLRQAARELFGLHPGDFALIVVGNDWKKKGLACLIEALAQIPAPHVRLLVVGRDDPLAFTAAIEKAGLRERILFFPPRPDVELYYAAADAYVGPSLDDSFAFPPLEAAACGLPVLTSRNNGGSEIITHGRDGLILEEPTNSACLAEMIRHLAGDPQFCRQLGDAAADLARSFTWERNAQQMRALIEKAQMQKQALQSLRSGEA